MRRNVLKRDIDKIAKQVVFDVGVAMSRRLMLSTYPLGPSQKKGKHGLKAGEASLRHDISKQNNSIAQASWRLKERGQTTRARQFAKLMRLSQYQDAINIAKGGNINLVRSNSVRHTYKDNNNSYSNVLITNNHTLTRYKIEKGKDIGKAKSGWIAPVGTWFSKRQKWINRHGRNGTFAMRNYTVTLTNNIPYIKDAMLPGAADKSFNIALKGVKTKFKTRAK